MDALLLARLARELEREWGDAWIQGVWQDTARRLVFRLRARGRSAFLLLSAWAEAPGIGLLERRPAVPPRPPALAAYLRAHVQGGRLLEVRSGFPERTVELRLAGPGGAYALHLEAVGRRSNAVVTDEGGRVRAALRWEDSDRSPLRPLRPGEAYRPPPDPQNLLAPAEVAAADLADWVVRGEPLHRRVAGLGAVLAKEVAHRAAAGEPVTALAEVLEAGRNPTGPVFEYPDRLSAVRLRHRPEAPTEHPSGLARAGTWLQETRARREQGERERRAEQGSRRARERLERRAAALRAELARLEDPADLRRRAEALAAHLWTVPAGAATVALPDPREPERLATVTLDPALSPGQNLDRLYGEVRRAERAREVLTRRLAEAERERAADPTAGEDPIRGDRGEELASGPFRRYTSSDGWPIWVGRNGPENDRLLRLARPWDLWLHGRDGPGAHVLIRLPGREARVPSRTLTEAAGLAARYSTRAAEGLVDVMVLEAGRVHKPKGAAPGRVVVAGERTVRVPPGAGNPRPVGPRTRGAGG